MSTDRDYISATLDSIPVDVPLDHRLYVKIGDRYVQFRASGDTITAERLRRLRTKGVQTLFILQSEYLRYIAGMETLLSETGIQNEDEASCLRVRELMMAYFRQLEERRDVDPAFLGKILGAAKQLPIAVGQRKELALKLLHRNPDPSMYFSNHAVNTSVYALTIGLKLRHPLARLQTVAMAGLVANIGIIQVPESILYKDGPLSEEELAEIKKHPLYGFNLLKRLLAPSDVAEAVLHHHERFDGSGYPHGLVGENISLAARIVSIAEVFSAMTSLRPWAAPLSAQEAIQRMISLKKFDPRILGDGSDGND